MPYNPSYKVLTTIFTKSHLTLPSPSSPSPSPSPSPPPTPTPSSPSPSSPSAAGARRQRLRPHGLHPSRFLFGHQNGLSRKALVQASGVYLDPPTTLYCSPKLPLNEKYQSPLKGTWGVLVGVEGLGVEGFTMATIFYLKLEVRNRAGANHNDARRGRHRSEATNGKPPRPCKISGLRNMPQTNIQDPLITLRIP